MPLICNPRIVYHFQKQEQQKQNYVDVTFSKKNELENLWSDFPMNEKVAYSDLNLDPRTGE